MQHEPEDRIAAIVANLSGIPVTQLSASDRFVEDLGIDSLGMFELRTAIEREFGFVIPDGDVTHLRSISSVARYLSDRGTG